MFPQVSSDITFLCLYGVGCDRRYASKILDRNGSQSDGLLFFCKADRLPELGILSSAIEDRQAYFLNCFVVSLDFGHKPFPIRSFPVLPTCNHLFGILMFISYVNRSPEASSSLTTRPFSSLKILRRACYPNRYLRDDNCLWKSQGRQNEMIARTAHCFRFGGQAAEIVAGR